MVHLDTNALIYALVPGTPQDQGLRDWLTAGKPIGIAAPAWAEFLCGPLDPAAVALDDLVLPSGTVHRRRRRTGRGPVQRDRPPAGQLSGLHDRCRRDPRRGRIGDGERRRLPTVRAAGASPGAAVSPTMPGTSPGQLQPGGLTFDQISVDPNRRRALTIRLHRPARAGRPPRSRFRNMFVVVQPAPRTNRATRRFATASAVLVSFGPVLPWTSTRPTTIRSSSLVVAN